MRESDEYRITSNGEGLDLDVIHGYLTRSYWAAGISRELVQHSIQNSLCFCALRGSDLVGFARVISDRATFAYICDVFVLEPHQGHGVGKRLIAAIRAHPELQGLRRWMLATRDAHGLYRQFGFENAPRPENLMEIVKRDPYGATARGE